MPVRYSYRRLWQRDEWYWTKMKKRHAGMWRFLEAFVKMNNEGYISIFEVGGGAGDVSQWTKGAYTGIERSSTMVELGRSKYPDGEFVLDDFVHMDSRQYADKRYALFFSASTIEHCPGYQSFIQRALDVNTALIIITFFRGLLWPEDRFCKVITPDGIYYENHYSGRGLAQYLNDEGLNYQFYTIKRGDENRVDDVVLVIDSRGDKDEEFWADIDSIGLTRRGYGEWARESWECTMAGLRQKNWEGKKKALNDARSMNQASQT